MTSSLLFIADISGFTRFVNETEINHSRHIVSELLEVLIDENELGMEVAEIEGDAVLFYLYGRVPSIEALVEQSKRMYLQFQSHLHNYKHKRICHCGACKTAQELSLKFVAHKGYFSFVKVKQFNKPHGPDVVLAHRLLKNNVDGNEYLLVTDGLLEGIDTRQLLRNFPWIKLQKGAAEYDNLGPTPYNSISLQPLNDQITVKPSVFPELTNNPIAVEDDVQLDSASLFELITNFDFREQWNDGPTRFEYEKDRVNRMGTRHVCVFDSEDIEFETVSNDFGPNKLVYGERLRNYKFVKEATNYFILEDEGEHTHLRIESHVKPKSLIIQLFSPFYKRIFKKNLVKVLNDIKATADKVRSRGRIQAVA